MSLNTASVRESPAVSTPTFRAVYFQFKALSFRPTCSAQSSRNISSSSGSARRKFIQCMKPLWYSGSTSTTGGAGGAGGAFAASLRARPGSASAPVGGNSASGRVQNLATRVASSTHLSTVCRCNGAPRSMICPEPATSNSSSASALSRQPSALAALTAVARAPSSAGTSSRAATASRNAARCSSSLALASARCDSSHAARRSNGSPNRSPERPRCWRPESNALLAVCQSPCAAASSPARPEASAAMK
mmetsp:Transcript_20554/g.64478  ORF Transcript_20554/g.64478 Transcript_20554/m.64478 type:complete len:248 (+) Transcript_20554:226-969(+)